MPSSTCSAEFSQGFTFVRTFSKDDEKKYGVFSFTWDFLADRLNHVFSSSAFILPEFDIDLVALSRLITPYIAWAVKLASTNSGDVLPSKADTEAS
jgi:hypothetical protein